jgi:circadian clock protein KaiC
MDTWISLRDMDANGERNRVLQLLKSRGMNHSNQMREYELSERGIRLIDAYIGSGGVLTGTARLAQEARERDEALKRQQVTEQRQRELARKRAMIERQIAEMRAGIEAEEIEIETLIEQEKARETVFGADRIAMAASRGMAGQDHARAGRGDRGATRGEAAV